MLGTLSQSVNDQTSSFKSVSRIIGREDYEVESAGASE